MDSAWEDSGEIDSELKRGALHESGAAQPPLPLLLELGDSGSSERLCENKLYPLLSEVDPGLNGVVLSRAKVGLGGSALTDGSQGDGDLSKQMGFRSFR